MTQQSNLRFRDGRQLPLLLVILVHTADNVIPPKRRTLLVDAGAGGECSPPVVLHQIQLSVGFQFIAQPEALV